MKDTRTNKGLVVIPQDSLVRMNSTLSFMKLLKIKGRTDVSLGHIGESLNLPPSLLVSDLLLLGIGDGVRQIFSIGQLIDSMEVALGNSQINEAFLVGTGRLGNMLLRYPGFKECGLRIIAAFDVKTSLIGTEIASIKVLNPDKIANLADRMHVSLGLVATPADQAQKTADLLVEAGIRVIWNFSLREVTVPSDIILESSSIHSDLKETFIRLNSRFRSMLRSSSNSR